MECNDLAYDKDKTLWQIVLYWLYLDKNQKNYV